MLLLTVVTVVDFLSGLQMLFPSLSAVGQDPFISHGCSALVMKTDLSTALFVSSHSPLSFAPTLPTLELSVLLVSTCMQIPTACIYLYISDLS